MLNKNNEKVTERLANETMFPVGTILHDEIGKTINERLGILINLRNDGAVQDCVNNDCNNSLWFKWNKKYMDLKKAREILLGY